MSSKRLKEKTVASRRPPSNGRPRYYSAMCLSKLKPYKKNPRHNEEAVAAVVKSIEQFGKIAPIIVNEKLRICAGHTRFKAAIERGERTFPTLIVPGLTGERFKAYNIADNQTASIAQWDTQGLAEIIKELQDEGFPTETLGFAEDQLDEILASLEDDFAGKTDPDDVPEPPKKAISKTGDLWLCGDHRLLCGDATKAEDVERVMDGEKALLFATDPPYGCNAGSIGFTAQRDDIEAITKDDLEGHEMQAFLESCFQVVIPHLAMNAAWYLWHPMLTQGYFAAAAAVAADLIIHRQIIWQKEQFIFGRGDYHWQHELCFYGWRQGYRPAFYGERNQSTIWIVPWDEKRSKIGHPTVKPIKLFACPMENHLRKGQLVLDPFLGSGTTMIAAEKLKRKCYGMEIEPIYVDVAVLRWQKYTGKKAVLIRKGKQSKITMPEMQEVAV